MPASNEFSENPKHDASEPETAAPPVSRADDREEAVRLSNIDRRNLKSLLELQARSAAERHDRATVCAVRYAERIAKIPPI